MLTAAFILFLGLTPAAISAWISWRSQPRHAAQFALALDAVQRRQFRELIVPPVADRRYVDGLDWVIGDITCEHNARSAYLRCAINPFGPCGECKHYQGKDL